MHIEIQLVSLDEKIIPFSRFAELVRNMGRIYGAEPEEEGGVYHIHAWDAGGKFKILGSMSDVFEHFASVYPDLVGQLVSSRGAVPTAATSVKGSDIAFCVRIISPSLTSDVQVLQILNVLFARNRTGIYFESFPGGMAIYAENEKAFSVVTSVFDPDYVRWKEENRNLMDTDPLLFFEKMKEFLGL